MINAFLGGARTGSGRKSKRAKSRFAKARDLRFEHLEDKAMLSTVPAGFTETRVASALSSPTSLVAADDGRVFVAQQNGVIKVVKNDAILPTPFAALQADSNGERGLLGITLDPNFETNHYVYVFYTASSPTSHMRISRLTANGDTMLAGSEVDLMDFATISPSAIWRMGGAIHFGPDGKLYVSVGDEQNAAFPQSLDNPFGKILRINPDGSIPTDNPFYNTTTGINRAIWAYGLRNPYTTAFQPGTGKFFINDVGQSSWEEIDQGAAGKNFGWPTTEGTFNQSQFPGFTEPVYAYSHNNGTAITGGAFYDPQFAQFPSNYVDKYFFADFGTGEIRILNPANGAVGVFVTGANFPTNLIVSDTGALYYLSRGVGTGGPGTGTGQLFKIQYSANKAPQIMSSPADALVSVGYGTTFSVAVSGTSPFTYQWQRNSVDIPNATAATYTVTNASLADNGAKYRVVVTNSFGAATSNAAVLSVTTIPPPTAEIVLPTDGTTYVAGKSFHVEGIGTDAQDGDLAPTQFVWQVDFQHETHAHPFIPPTGDTSSIDFTIPTVGETSDEVWYRIYLTVTDSLGLSTTVFRDILPVKSNFTLGTNIPGLSLTLDGQPESMPLTVTGVVGIQRSLQAPLVQTVGGKTYLFQSWSDGGTATHNINTPATDTTYTANYIQVVGTYLSNMPFMGTPGNGWGPVERDESNGEKKAGDGHAIKLNGVTYQKGLGVNSNSSIVFNLAGNYQQFVSDIGVDDEEGANGSADFQIWANGSVLFDSGKMTATSPTQTISLDVTGLQQIRLVVTDAGDGIAYDHADWANAELFAPPGSTSSPPPPPAGFSTAVNYATGVNAHSVVSTDVNGDGKLDLVVVNSGSNNVSVLFGNGDGTFARAVNYGVGKGPKSVKAADLNGDGAIDLAVVNQDSANISVLMNRGDGTFLPQVVYAGVAGGHDLDLADLNGDGNIDIAAVGWGANVARVLLNNGNGTFKPGINYAVGKQPHSIVAVDLNGDGKADLAAADRAGNNVAVLINKGNGTFNAAKLIGVGKLPHSIRAGDLNGDGKIDLVAANDGANSVSILYGNGDGTFRGPQNLAVGPVPKWVELGDVNGDGKLDILTANTAGNYPTGNHPGGNTVSVLINAGNGTFSKPKTVLTGTTPFCIALADFDGDGDLDMATANWTSNNISVLLWQ